jgi:flagellar hook-length control protein FliK
MNNVGLNSLKIKSTGSAKTSRDADLILAGRRDGNNMRAFDKSFSVKESRNKSPEKETQFENILSEKYKAKKYSDDDQPKIADGVRSESGADKSKSKKQEVQSSEVAPQEVQPRSREIYADNGQDVNADQRQVESDPKLKAMQSFLEKMDSTLGIDGEKLIAAFSRLSIADLASSPEQSAEALLAQFDLDPQQYKVASQLYAEMLAMTSMAGLETQLQSQNQEAELSVLSNADAKKSSARAGIKSMQDSFFVDGKASVVDKQLAKTMNTPTPTQSLVLENDLGHDVDVESVTWSTNLEPETTVDILDRMETLARFANRAKIANGSPMSAEGAKSLGNGSALADAPGLLGRDLGANSLTTNPTDVMSSQEAMSGNAATALPAEENPFAFVNLSKNANEGVEMEDNANWMNESYTTAKAKEPAAGNESGFGAFEDSDDGSDPEEMMSDSADGTEQFSQFRDNKVQGAKAEFTIAKPTATPVELQNNIKDIVGHTQMLLKNGGGEMKVKLSPEGLGDLNLKVKMVDGQVNVEMVTASDEAKKLLEKGLADLKESLASNKLNLESIKIESTKESASQLAQQQQDLERQSAQKFLQDFRDRNFMNRNQMFGMPGPRNLDSQTTDLAVNTSYGVKKKLSDRRLDLVA